MISHLKHSNWIIFEGSPINRGKQVLQIILDTALDLFTLDRDVRITAQPPDCTGDVRFAVNGDFGEAGQPEVDMSRPR